MTDTREFLAAVADRLPLLDLAREYMELRRVGRSFRGRCPIHGGQGLSFDISPARNLFHCFAASCEAGGDIAEFAMRHPAIPVRSFPDALRWLADRTGLVPPREQGINAVTRQAAEQERARLADALDFGVRFYRFVRDRRADGFQAMCEGYGLDVHFATAHGAALSLGGEELSRNIQAKCPAITWPAFRRLGLIVFDGDAGSPTARSTMRDVLPGGLVWEVYDRGQIAGHAAVSPTGELVAITSPARGRDPRTGIVVHQSLCLPDAPDGPVAVWESLEDFWRRGQATPLPSVVPVQPWLTDDGAERLRRQLRGRLGQGILGGSTSPAAWLSPAVMAALDGVRAIGPDAAVLHPVEHAWNTGYSADWGHVAATIPDPLTRLVVDGWLAAQRTGLEAA